MAAEPEAGKEVLRNNHAKTNHHGIGDAQLVIAGEAITTEDGTTNDRLQKIVGKAHATENAQMMKNLAHTLESIPC